MMKLYVATNGNDQWSGTLDSPNADGTDGPFATLTRSRDAIRQLKYANKFDQAVEVQVRGGTYYLTEALRLSAGDSGTDQCPIIYRAYPGEKPVLSGGRHITKWKPYKNNIVCSKLSEVRSGKWWFRQLFFGGKRMIRARWPKYDRSDPIYGGWAFVEAPVSESDELKNVSKIELGPVWRFKPDPQKIGDQKRWFAADTPDEDWAQLRTDQHWNMQGFGELHGSGWYRFRFSMPEDFDTRRHLWLVFGGVDKEAYIYIDGKKVFEHTLLSTGLDYEQIWDKPFKFDARELLKPGQEHVITVRADSNFVGGGIHMPVLLVSSEKEVALRLLCDVIDNPVAFRYELGVFTRRWAKPEQAEVFIFPGLCWINDIIPIKRMDLENRTIHLARPVEPSNEGQGKVMALRIGNRFYVENVLEELTEPGEWCLDTDTGTLYFWPPEGDILSAEAVAPVTGRLLQLVGAPDDPIRHVTIRGFTLTQTLAEFPNPHCHYKTPNAGQTLYMENSEDCTVEDTFFDSVGGDAIRLQNKNARNRIINNEIAYTGAYGIFLGGFQRGFSRDCTSSGDVPAPSDWHDYPQDRDAVVKAWPRSSNHLISNNHIHHVGVFEKHAQGIAMYGVSAVDVVVSHNLIHHTPRFGIGLMSGFGRVTIEYNELHDLSLETSDTGGICSNRWYTYAEDPDLGRGNIIRFNRIRDVVGCGAYGRRAEPGSGEIAAKIWHPYYSWAIYFDNAPMDVLVYGNICARNALGGIIVSAYGRDVTVENNIFVDSDRSQVYMILVGAMGNVRFRRNIFNYSDPDADLMRLILGQDITLTDIIEEFDENLFFNASGKQLTFSGLPSEAMGRVGNAVEEDIGDMAEGWRTMGFDEHSMIADPKFVDPASDNYDLQPDSPTPKLGFKPIDSSQIGRIQKVD